MLIGLPLPDITKDQFMHFEDGPVGAGFVSSSTLLWNGSSRSTVFVSSGQLRAQLASADLAVSTTASVTVFSPAPGGGVDVGKARIRDALTFVQAMTRPEEPGVVHDVGDTLPLRLQSIQISSTL